MAGEGRSSRVNFDDDKQLVFETSANVKVVASFEAMGLKEELVRGIFAYGAGVVGGRHSATRLRKVGARSRSLVCAYMLSLSLSLSLFLSLSLCVCDRL
jgi:hypothetical protein